MDFLSLDLESKVFLFNFWLSCLPVMKPKSFSSLCKTRRTRGQAGQAGDMVILVTGCVAGGGGKLPAGPGGLCPRSRDRRLPSLSDCWTDDWSPLLCGRGLETVCGGACGLAGPHLFWIPVTQLLMAHVCWSSGAVWAPVPQLATWVQQQAQPLPGSPTWAGPRPQRTSRQCTWHRYAVVTRARVSGTQPSPGVG